MKKITILISALILLSGISLYSQDNNWSHFRGSNLDGICRTANIPEKWNDTTNILWKVPISGKGWSSPVVWGNQVWITTATTDGKQMFGVCLDKRTGKEIFNQKLFESATTYSKHDFNTYATPTPCIEEGFVYIHFGTSGTA